MNIPDFPRASLWAGLCLGLLIGLPAPAATSDGASPAKPATITILSPKTGARFTAPGPVVVEAQAVDPLGDIRHLDFYDGGRLVGSSDYLLKIAVIPGRPIPHRFEWKDVPVGTHQLDAWGKDTAGNTVVSAPVTIEVAAPEPQGFGLVQAGSEWRWRYDGAAPGDGWRTAAFNDAGWKSGKAQLGFGEGDEATVIWTGEGPYPITAYFRQAFEMPADLEFSGLRLRLLRDDGAVVYLNGRELVRDNMPGGTVGPGTLASAATEGVAFRTYSVGTAGLVVGRNVVGVEVHQYAASSGDLSFDLDLVGLPIPVQEPPVVGIVASRPATSEPAPNIRVIPGQFTLRRTGPTQAALPVFVNFTGTATAGADYTRVPGDLVIPAGQAELAIDIQPLDDDRVEGTETVIATLALAEIAQSGSAARVVPTYRIDPAKASARVEIHDTDRPMPPASIVIREPQSGARFDAGVPVVFHAVAIDPAAYISRVEFLDGDTRIGVSEITFIRAPDPGTPIEHTFEWQGASAGEHRVTARSLDLAGKPVVSEPVILHIGDTPLEQVVIEVTAAAAEAAEPEAGAEAKNGVFLIQRTAGPRNVAVYVAYALEGTAANGVDYVRLPSEVTLPAGRDSIEIVVRPLADALREGDEKVVLVLRPIPCIAIYPPPPECYGIGKRELAAVVIHDTPTANQAPRVAVVAPRNGSVTLSGEPIAIRAEASDANGSIARIDLLADGRVIRSAEQATLGMEWKDAAPGTHKLTARAVDNLGAESTSPVVTILVRDRTDLSFVKRELPPAYLPGGPFDVVLIATPPASTLAWTAEDTAPTGWAVTAEGGDAGVIAARGTVRFGPFTDARPRRLVYRVTPSTHAVGAGTFTGTSSIDGRTVPILGEDAVVPAGERHPADASAADGAISADEVTTYAAAWKVGRPWGDGGAIPAEYVTRAGQIWRLGGRYTFIPTKGSPPECWVPATASASAPAADAGGEASTGTAVRRFAGNWKPGTAGTVILSVTPAAGTEAVCVEESVPAGWGMGRISGGGVFDPATSRVRWGILFGEEARELTYEIVPPPDAASNGTFSGRASFDGRVAEVPGERVAGAADAATALRIAGVRRGEGGRVHFRVQSVPDQVFVVEVSSDLAHWSEAGVFVQTGEEFEIPEADAGAGAAGNRYYRLRPMGL